MLEEPTRDDPLIQAERIWAWFVPPERNRAVPWGAMEILWVLVGFGVVLPVSIMLLWRRLYPAIPQDELMLDAVVTSGLITLLGVPWLLSRMSGAQAYQMGVHFGRFGRNVVLGIAAWFVATPVVMLVLAALLHFLKRTPHAVEQMIQRLPTLDRFALAAVAVIVIAPLQEELVFRGVLQPWLRRLVGPRLAIVGSSLIFAALHTDAWPAPIPLFVLALFLGYLAHRTGSLVAPVILHAMFNAANLLMLSIAMSRGA